MPKTVTFEGTTHQFPDDATDAEVSAALNSAHPSPVMGADRLPGGAAPGVDKPALPAALRPDAPEFSGDSYGSELPVPSSNFATDGISRVGRGLTEIGAGPYSGVEQKNGVAHGSRMSRGVSDVIRGAGEVASPLTPGLVAAAPVAAISGAAGGVAGEGAGRGVASILGGDEDQQNASGDVLGVASGHFGSKIGEFLSGVIPHYVRDRGVQDATVEALMPFGIGKGVNKWRTSLEAVPIPKPRPDVSGTYSRVPGWDGVQNARGPRIVEPGSRIGQNEFAQPLDPVESLPSGRVPGGIHNVTEPAARPSREPALWQQYGAEPISTEPVEFKPIQGELPSGRYPVSSRFPEAPVPPRPARVPGWMDRGVSVSQDEPVRFSSLRGALPSGRTPGAFDVPHQAQILPQEIRPVPLSESPDMQDILRQSIEAIKARKNGSAPPSDEPSAFPLNVRRRK